jgi:hypothetical protein
MCHSSANHLPPRDGHTAGPLPLTHISCAGTATHYPQQKCPAAATAQGSCDSSQPVLVLGLSPAGQTPPSSPLAIAEQQPCAHTHPRDPACCSWGHSTCTIPSAAPIACTPRVLLNSQPKMLPTMSCNMLAHCQAPTTAPTVLHLHTPNPLVQATQQLHHHSCWRSQGSHCVCWAPPRVCAGAGMLAQHPLPPFCSPQDTNSSREHKQ